MSAQGYLSALQQGVRAWNSWRKSHSGMSLDLSNINLENRNLQNANFREVNFEGANLKGAILSNSDLSYANLDRVNLSNANLMNTNLGETIFKDTVLEGTKFQQASLRGTMFLNVNLSVTQGLNKVSHLGPSTIDLDTIHTSKGNIPEAFLLGAGIHPTFIKYIRSQGRAPFSYYSCFISYASEDEPFVDCLYKDLKAEGVQCWLAPVILMPGDRFPQKIEDAIRHHDKLILVLSKYSIESGWVEHEVSLARQREKKGKDILFPIRLDNAYTYSGTDWVRSLQQTRHIGNFEHWVNPYHYEIAFKQLLEGLEK